MGIGLLVARIGLEHVTLVYNQSVDMPVFVKPLGHHFLHYLESVHELDVRLRLSLRDIGIDFGDH